MISEHSDHDALAARLAAIDAEPLEARAAGYAQLHDELRSRLDGSANESSSIESSTRATPVSATTKAVRE